MINPNQSTIKNKFELVGYEPYGGNIVKVGFYPADSDTGIVFSTKKGSIVASLDHASQYKSSVLLRDGDLGVLHVEHLLATLYAYGVDNLRVNVERQPSKSFRLLEKIGLSSFCEVVPNFKDKTYSLCEKLDDNIEEQNSPRKLLSLGNNVGDLERDRLIFEPYYKNGLFIEATTDYPILGEQTVSLMLNAETYKREIAKSRPYSKHAARLPSCLMGIIAAAANPNFGIGHGFDPETNVLLPIYDESDFPKMKSIYQSADEPARHTIMDRLGALSLLPGRFNGVKITAKFSGHANDIAVLNRFRFYFVES